MNNLRMDVRRFVKPKILEHMEEMCYLVKIKWKIVRDVQYYTMDAVGDFGDMLKTKELVFDNVVLPNVRN